MTPRPAPITDSPLFWVLLFGTVGLVMLSVVEPKFIQRQERIMRMQESRQRAKPAAADMTEDDLTSGQSMPAWQPTRQASLRPLMLFLAGVLLATMAAMHVRRHRAMTEYRRAHASSAERERS